MKFGEVAVADADGAILAHSARLPGRSLKKGRVLDASDVAALRDAGRARIVVARLEPGDVHEDEAARALAAPLLGSGLRASEPFTGRVNLFATSSGVLVLEPGRIDALNAVHEALTVATLGPWTWVRERQMVATVKVIPFSAPAPALAAACAAAAGAQIRVAVPRARRIGLVQSRLQGTPDKLLDKTERVLRERVLGVGCTLTDEARVAHQAEAVAQAVRAQLAAGCDLVLVAGASAIVDRRDVVPAAIEAAGGQVLHFGMPVDPGNLVLVARIGEVPVIGLPGCARSPAFNGFDWVLQRLATDLPVGSHELTMMGAGGLLKEMGGRPSPRAQSRDQAADAATVTQAPTVGALVLAAGQSRRMGALNKLLAVLDDEPMVRVSTRAVLASQATPVVVVTGHEAARIEAALAGLEVSFVHNPDYAQGLSTSLTAGLAALPGGLDAALICLGDMPRIGASVIDKLMAAFDPLEGRAICVPTWRGKRGNPVLFGARFFAAMREVRGDIGARYLLGEHEDLVCEVAVDHHAVLEDVDSPADLSALRAALEDGDDAGAAPAS